MPGGAPGALIRLLTCVHCAEGVNSAPACDHSTLICHLHGHAQTAPAPVVAAAAEAPQSRRLTDCCEGAEAPVKAACRTSLPVYTRVCQCTTDSVWTIPMAPAVLAVQVSKTRGFGALQS